MPSRPDWLAKALYEMSGELHTRLTAFPEHAADDHAVANVESPRELARLLRNRERITGYHVEQFAYGRPRELRLHELEWLEPDPTAPDDAFDAHDIEELMYEFVGLRRRTCSLFWGLSDRDWDASAHHRFLGEVTLEALVVALHEHDIEALWKAKKLADALGVPQPHAG